MTLLDELRKGELDPAAAAEVRAHAEACAECRSTLAVLEALADAVALHREALFDEHPGAEELVEFAEGGDSLPLARLAQVRAHLQVCATCRVELQAARRVQDRLGGTALRLRIGLARPQVRWALAACIVFALGLLGRQLLTTATAGLRKEKQALVERLLAVEESVEVAQAHLRTLRGWSGSLSSLAVPGGVRHAGSPASRADTVSLRAGQPFLPILIDFNISGSFATARQLEARVLSAETGGAVWQLVGQAQDWWDASLGVLSLALPLGQAPPGAYRFELISQDDHRLLCRTEFLLVSPPDAQGQ